MTEKDKWTIRDELIMFLELCAGLASLSRMFPIRQDTRIMRSKIGISYVDIPLPADPIEWLTPWNKLNTDALMFKTESITMNKVAWQWQTTPKGKRLYTIQVGSGIESNTICYSDPRMYVWQNYLLAWDQVEFKNGAMVFV